MMAAFAQDRDVVTVDDVKRRDRRTAVGRVRRALGQAAGAARSATSCALHSVDATGERRVVLGRILVGVNGQTIAERELTPGRFIIGRTPDNDLQIDSKYISRHHAQIITSVHTSVLEDLNSTNGIYVRSKRVRRRMLNDGDVVQIGQHEIMYFDERLSRTRVAVGRRRGRRGAAAAGRRAAIASSTTATRTKTRTTASRRRCRSARTGMTSQLSRQQRPESTSRLDQSSSDRLLYSAWRVR